MRTPGLLLATCCAALTTACASLGRPRAPVRAASEGAIFAYVQPIPARGAAAALALDDVVAVTAIRGDGEEVPLALPPRTTQRIAAQRTLATATVPSGAYAGLRLRLAGPTREAPADDAAVGGEQVELRASFTVVEGRAVVLWVSVKDEQLVAEAPLSSLLSVNIAHAAVPEDAGAAADAASASVVLFDTRYKLVTGALLLEGSPGGVALDARTRRLYASVPDHDQLRSFDLATGEPRDALRVRPGDAPGPLALVPGRSLLLAVNLGSRTVSFLDTAGLVEFARVPVGDQPSSILVDHAGARAFVFNRRSNSITAIDLANAAIAGTIGTDAEPLAGALDRAGTRLAVVSRGSMYVTIFSLPSFAPAARLFVGLGATAVQFDQQTDLLYVAHGGALQLFPPGSSLPMVRIPLPATPAKLAVHDLDNTMFALHQGPGGIAILDLASHTEIARLEVGAEPVDLAITGERR